MTYDKALDLVYLKMLTDSIDAKKAFGLLKLNYSYQNFWRRLYTKYPEIKLTTNSAVKAIKHKMLCDNLCLKDARIALNISISYDPLRKTMRKQYPELRYLTKERAFYGIRFQDSLSSKIPEFYTEIDFDSWYKLYSPYNSRHPLRVYLTNDVAMNAIPGCYIWSYVTKKEKVFLRAGFNRNARAYIVCNVMHGFNALEVELTKDFILKIKNLNLQF